MSEDAGAIGHFVAKWQGREPEMRWTEVFCPAPDKARFRAWGALLHELREALFELSDARVRAAKTAWWAEELIGLAQGRSRHPLSQSFLGMSAPWPALSRALLEPAEADVRSADTEQAIQALLSLAMAVVAVESALFETAADDAVARSLAVHWLAQRLPQGLAMEDRARIPMHLFARHGIGAAQLVAEQGKPLLRDWAGELADASAPRLPGVALIRRSRHRFDRARLQRIAAGKGCSEPPAPAVLWRAWQAARES
jgi:hypothetical protein